MLVGSAKRNQLQKSSGKEKKSGGKGTVLVDGWLAGSQQGLYSIIQVFGLAGW